MSDQDLFEAQITRLVDTLDLYIAARIEAADKQGSHEFTLRLRDAKAKLMEELAVNLMPFFPSAKHVQDEE